MSVRDWCRELVKRGVYGSVEECVRELEGVDDVYYCVRSVGCVGFELGVSAWIRCVLRTRELLEALVGKRVGVNWSIFRSLLRRVERGAKPYCPCSVVRVDANVCPCVWCFAEVVRFGRCACGLFFVEKEEG